MARDTMYVVPAKETRQAQIEAMEIGDSVSISRRLTLDMGITQDAIAEHTHQIRGIFDQQASRARKRVTGSQYMVENGAFITRGGALVITAVCTRIN